MKHIKIFGVYVEIEEIDEVSVYNSVSDTMYNNVLYKIKNCNNVGYDGIELVEGISNILYARYEDDAEDCVFSLGHYNREDFVGKVFTAYESFVKVISWRGRIDDIKDR